MNRLQPFLFLRMQSFFARGCQGRKRMFGQSDNTVNQARDSEDDFGMEEEEGVWGKVEDTFCGKTNERMKKWRKT